METLTGIGTEDRKRLSELFRETRGTISVTDTAGILKITSTDAAKMLSRWAKKGWLSRVRRGLYVRVALESRTADIPLEDAWIIAVRLFSPCYIGGWSAAEYWDLTEQIFRTVVVLTTQKPRDRAPVIKGTGFMLYTISEKALFGIKPVWKGQVKVSVADPTRTILDMLTDPKLGGGIRPTVDIFLNYLKSENNNIQLLIDYAKQLGNGAVFKRLGFLLERYAPDQEAALNECRAQMTKGNTNLDPSLKADRLITRWRLWVPENWIDQKRRHSSSNGEN
ncbi:MAG: type IV toxin-antitoxin system AbiEi family antitoxin domain-containing protein [Nitrospirae bacterium]|nr:type IV toxin-antitoxin system AbiEi family antitoxin domain-containing protein [Nitrospirota bacterium]